MRTLLITLLVLLALAVGADRVALLVTESVVADRMQTAGELDSKPSVKIRGFPFLTQAIRGHYDRIDVHATDLKRSGVTLGTLDVRANDAQVALSDALGGQVSRVPVSGLKARAVVSYVTLASSSGIAGLTVVPDGELVDVSGRITVAGQSFTARAVSAVRLDGQRIVITAKKVTILGAHNALFDKYVASQLDFSVRIGKLPFGLRLTGATATTQGVVLNAETGPTVLSTPDGG